MKRVKRILLIVILCVFGKTKAQVNTDNANISWDQQSVVKIANGGYGRIRELSNGVLAAVYSRASDAYIKFSSDQGKTWNHERLVFKGDSAYSFTNCELIELSDHSLVLGVNRRVASRYARQKFTYAIAVARSIDYGQSWTEQQVIYTAGNEMGIGCWEPAFLLLPDGELQCYFANEFPYPETDEQEISLLRSADNGRTWSKQAEKVCFAKNGRDGMPVPALDVKSGEILVAIEENHNREHLLQPVIIHTSIKDNWRGGFVDANDERRIHVTPDMPKNQYAGAPYIAISKKGWMLLSFQDRSGRAVDKELMKVRVSDSYLNPFLKESVPFLIDTNQSALWNSLTILHDETILAVTSTSGFDKGIYLIKGRFNLKKY